VTGVLTCALRSDPAHFQLTTSSQLREVGLSSHSTRLHSVVLRRVGPSLTAWHLTQTLTMEYQRDLARWQQHSSSAIDGRNSKFLSCDLTPLAWAPRLSAKSFAV
jgi:hypothetical protein